MTKTSKKIRSFACLNQNVAISMSRHCSSDFAHTILMHLIRVAIA